MSRTQRVQQPPTPSHVAIRLVVSFVFGAFLSCALTIALVLSVLLWSLSQEQLVRDAFTRSYCEDVLALVDERLNAYAQASGLEQTIVEGTFTVKDVQRDVRGFVDAQLAGADYTCDTTEALEGLRGRLVALLRSQRDLTEEQIRTVVNACERDVHSLYEASICVRGIEAVAQARTNVAVPLKRALAGVCVYTVILAIAVVRLRQTAADRLQALAACVEGTGLACTIIPLWLERIGWCDQLALGPAYLSPVIARMVSTLIGVWYDVGMGCLLVAAAALVFIAAMRE